ncbi:energy transducer TonB [Flavobacterium sp.]|uniref:energy transducer TonB n=1 Tax=Flavobacterium sp. TaxID=239 RepID=UPI0039C8B5F9
MNSDNSKDYNQAVINETYSLKGLDVKPEFPGGINEFYKFIAQNYTVPKEKPIDVKGKIYATFIIEKDGLITDVKIIKDLGFNTGNEAIRVLKLSPKWTPGKQNNKDVRVLYTIPMSIN